MKEPLPHPQEDSRLGTLRDLGILDSESEERFDRVTRIAKSIFDVPIALVSLVDETRQWFKSRQGLEASETPRNISFCGHAILDDAIFEIPDTHLDERFCDNPLVTGEPQIRSYLGVPLISRQGLALGTLCLIDREPRQYDEAQKIIVRDLAKIVEGELYNKNLEFIQNKLNKAGDELRRISERLMLATRAGGIGVWEYDIVTGELFWDDKMFELYGIKASDFPGAFEAWSSALHPDDSERAQYELQQAISGTKQFTTDFRIRLPDGALRIINASADVVRDDEGMPLRMVGVNMDITERKRMEKMKSEFVSTVSHELRTPLTSIKGALNLIAHKYSSELSSKPQKMLLLAERNCERLALLVNDILDLEKIESGLLEMNFAQVDLVEISKRAMEECLGYASEFDINLVFENTVSHATIFADHYRLTQVISNLLSNAIKFSNKGSSVTISIDETGEVYRLSVRDFGQGIPPEFREKIFNRFAQVDSSDSREKGGTGLGLSIAKSIMQQHGGEIGFESPDSGGTNFFITLNKIVEKASEI